MKLSKKQCSAIDARKNQATKMKISIIPPMTPTQSSILKTALDKLPC